MVLLREGLCPGLSEDLVKALREEDVRTGSACLTNRIIFPLNVNLALI